MFKEDTCIFYIIGKSSELLYDIKSHPGRIACSGKVKCRQSDPPQAENPAKQDPYSLSVEKSIRMTIDEARTCYNIPLAILHEYESWGLFDAVKKAVGAWQYDDQDIERLSVIMTLHDIGFLK